MAGVDLEKFPYYCAVPWNHLHVRANGEYGLCCRDVHEKRIKFSADNFSDFWNGEEIKSVRRAMMHNNPPSACEGCVNNTNNLASKYPEIENNRCKIFWKDIISQTLPDGTTSYLPKTIDVRTHLCNLRCRMCSPGSSSAIAVDYGKLGLPVPVIRHYSNVNAKLPLEILGGLTNIYWAGGEPFLSPIHWQVMEKLLVIGNNNLRVLYNTNCTFPGNTIDRAITLLKGFKDLRMNLSIDALNNDVEYIREGCSYAGLLQNFNLLRQQLNHCAFTVDCNATSVGLLSMADTIKSAESENVDIIIKAINVSNNGHYMDPCVLKPEVFSHSINQMILASNFSRNQKNILEISKKLSARYIPRKVNWDMVDLHEAISGKSGWYKSRMLNYVNV